MRSSSLPQPVRVALAVLLLGGVHLLDLGLVVVRAVRRLVTRTPAPEVLPYGVKLERFQEAGLWALVDEAARATGTRAPEELWVVPEVAVSVVAERRQGTRPGRRRTLLGAAVLVGLTEGELRALVAHELGHDSPHDGRVLPLVHQGVRTAARLVADVGDAGWAGRVVRAYGALAADAAEELTTRQELVADALAAEVVGTEPTASALQKVPHLERTWAHLDRTFLAPGRALGGTPVGVLSLLEQLVSSGGAPDEPARVLGVDGPEDPYDSHPPVLARVAALQRRPRPAPAGQARPAAALLEKPADLAARFDALLADGGARLLAWDDVVALVAPGAVGADAVRVLEAAERLSGARPAGLAEVLEDALHRPVALGLELLGADAPLDPSDRERAARAEVLAKARSLVSCALVAAGAARWTASLQGEPFHVSAGGSAVDLDGLLTGAFASAEGMTLFAQRLQAVGVDGRFRPDAPPAAVPGGTPVPVGAAR